MFLSYIFNNSWFTGYETSLNSLNQVVTIEARSPELQAKDPVFTASSGPAEAN
jgi:hypothetical protein